MFDEQSSDPSGNATTEVLLLRSAKPAGKIRLHTDADGLYTRELLGYVEKLAVVDVEHRLARAATYKLD